MGQPRWEKKSQNFMQYTSKHAQAWPFVSVQYKLGKLETSSALNFNIYTNKPAKPSNNSGVSCLSFEKS